MTEKINGRTPEEIKKGLLTCTQSGDCPNCPYERECNEHAASGENLWLGEPAMDDALALIQQLERERDAAAEAQPKWISVEERLPTELGEVMVCVYGRVTIAWYGGNGGFETGSGVIFWAGDDIVTHWMPLPEPPKEEA